MSKPKTVGDVFRSARAPYSHMSDKDARLFYATMNALLVYTNQRLHVVNPDALNPRPGNPDMLYTNGGRVSETLWKNRFLIDEFVRDNPLGVSQAQLELAHSWRHALRDMFTVIDADENRALYMNDDRIFVVGASQDPADAHVHHIPSLMLLTLVPFKGGIVTDGKTLHLAPQPAPWAIPAIGEKIAELAAHRLIATSHQLEAYARDVPDGENRLTERFQRAVDRGFASGEIA